MVLVPLFLASLLQSPIDAAVGRFYDGQLNPAPAWVQRNGITRQETALLEVVAHADREGLDPADYLTPTLDSLLHRDLTFDDAWRLDTLLTRTFFLYARDVSYGRVEPALVDSQWTRWARSMDLAAVLQLALDAEQMTPVLQGLAPPQTGYVALRDALERYRDIAQHGDWPVELGPRLAAEGYDITAGLRTAVRQFQLLHGLTPDGTVGLATRAALDVPAIVRAEQIALNLERWRWLPRDLGRRYIMVNSAAFTVELVDHDTVAWKARAIVGRTDWPTPIVSSTATDLVFRPVWTVPRTIAVLELLPIVRRDPGYLTRGGFRVFSDSAAVGEVDPSAVNWTAVTESTFAYQFVQEPGPENPLGGVKLVFWTPFSVFIHDTPARPLFSERWRTFSHGCIRVEGAAELAARLLLVWPDDSIRAAMTSGRQRWVRLPEPIPVHLVYWTAWATDDGLIAFAGDPYGWDAKLTRALDAHGAQRVTIKGASVR